MIVAPQTGDSQLNQYPNEDSLDFEFTDANLFGFNRFPGIDRLEGGERANVALHGAWYLGGTTFDGLIGQSYRTNKDNLFPEASGLHDQVSDIVARGTLRADQVAGPDLSDATRQDDSGNPLRRRRRPPSAWPKFRVTGGYIYTTFNPYTYYDQPPPPPAGNAFYFPRNEVSLGVSSTWGEYRFNGVRSARPRDQPDGRWPAADAIYEDECFIFDLRLFRRYT